MWLFKSHYGHQVDDNPDSDALISNTKKRLQLALELSKVNNVMDPEEVNDVMDQEEANDVMDSDETNCPDAVNPEEASGTDDINPDVAKDMDITNPDDAKGNSNFLEGFYADVGESCDCEVSFFFYLLSF